MQKKKKKSNYKIQKKKKRRELKWMWILNIYILLKVVDWLGTSSPHLIVVVFRKNLSPKSVGIYYIRMKRKCI